MSAVLAATRASWLTPTRAPWLVAAAGLALLCLAFRPEVQAAVTVWNTSTAYGHCWLVLPIVGWLLWERRLVLEAGVAHPSFWPVLLALPLAAFWTLADWLGIMEGRQLAVVGFAELLLIAALGFPLWWALSAAFLYLLFLVPFGAFLTPALQHFTTSFIIGGLHLLDIPVDADAFHIRIPEGMFYVAEACAGLRFLIASVAFGTLYAVTIFRSPWRRAAFIAVACVVPVVANGVRGLGIVLLGHLLGSAEAGAADHLIYGWVFFSAVILLLALAGLPFRQDSEADAAVPEPRSPPARPLALLLACVPVLLVAFAGPILAGGLGAHGRATAALVPRVLAPASCQAGASTLDGAVSAQLFQCGAARLRVIATTLPAGANPARILDAARLAALEGLGTDIDSEGWRSPAGRPWMMLSARDTGRNAAYAVWSGGTQMTGGLRDRLRMARGMMGGGQSVAISVVAEGQDADALRAFLRQDLLF